MKILWLCNIMLPTIAAELNLSYSNREGWLTGLFEQFRKEDNSDNELAICFPYSNREMINAIRVRMRKEEALRQTGRYKELEQKKLNKFHLGDIVCYSFHEELTMPEKYDEALEEQLNNILLDFQPEIIHIFGSEFPHALALVKVCVIPRRILLSISGLCGKIAEVYTAGIPTEIITGETFRDIVKNDSITQQQQKFSARAKHEQELFSLINHVAGRTSFDRESALAINPDLTYHHLNESMRDSFYFGEWKSDQCEPYSIFLSQGDYPVKGFHYILEAMPRILLRYPEAHLYVAGNDIIGGAGQDALGKFKRKIKVSSYAKYIKSLIFKYQLEDKVTMLGSLDEAAMKERFLKSSVFICPSIIENSPNALCEAMLLGMPVVAAAVGGIPSLLSDGRDGLLYEPGNATDLAAAIEIAWDPETYNVISKAAAKRAIRAHNRILVYMKLMKIYDAVIK